MPEERGLGSKLLGLFVEAKQGTPDEGTPAVEGAEAEKTAAELAGQAAPKKGSAPRPTPRQPPVRCPRCHRPRAP